MKHVLTINKHGSCLIWVSCLLPMEHKSKCKMKRFIAFTNRKTTQGYGAYLLKFKIRVTRIFYIIDIREITMQSKETGD